MDKIHNEDVLNIIRDKRHILRCIQLIINWLGHLSESRKPNTCTSLSVLERWREKT